MTERRTVETKFGTFTVRDDRSAGDHKSVATLYPIDQPDGTKGTFTINNKTYTGPVYVERQIWHTGEVHDYVTNPAWESGLTDSARAKLLEELRPLLADMPPLTHAEKFDRLKGSVRRSVEAKLEHEITGVVHDQVRDANMTQYDNHRGRSDLRDPLTDAELAELHAIVLDTVRAWLESVR